MKNLMIITRKEKLDVVKTVLQEFNFGGMTVTNVYGCGRQKGHLDTEGLRVQMDKGPEVVLLSKVRIDTIVQDEDVDELVDAVCRAACTGRRGDGKIFISNVEEAVRIRTRERSIDAI